MCCCIDDIRPQKMTTGNYFHVELKDRARNKPLACRQGSMDFLSEPLTSYYGKKKKKKLSSIFITFPIYGQLLNFCKEKKKNGGKMCTRTMFLLPWGSLVAVEFSDPETKPSPNQLVHIHMHTSERLITEANSTSQREFPSLKLTQTLKSIKSSVNTVFSIQHYVNLMLCWRRMLFKALITFQAL